MSCAAVVGQLLQAGEALGRRRRAACRPRPRAGSSSRRLTAGNESFWMSSQAPGLSLSARVVVAALDLVQALVELGDRASAGSLAPSGSSSSEPQPASGQAAAAAAAASRCRRVRVIALSRAVRRGCGETCSLDASRRLLDRVLDPPPAPRSTAPCRAAARRPGGRRRAAGPTLPGLSSHSPSREVQLASRRHAAPPAMAPSVRVKRSATWVWPIGGRRAAPSRPCTPRPAVPDSTYSQTGSRGLAWKRPIASPSRCGSSDSEELERASPACSRVQRAACGGVRGEVGDVDLVQHAEVVVPGQAQIGTARRASLHALVGVGAVAHQVAQAPDRGRVRRRPRPRARPGRPGRLPCTSESTAIFRGSPLLSGGMGGHR